MASAIRRKIKEKGLANQGPSGKFYEENMGLIGKL
jgi:hypothetical protein